MIKKVILINSDRMGVGEEEFGHQMMKKFSNGLADLDEKPEKLVSMD